MSKPVVLHNNLVEVNKKEKVDTILKTILILESFFGVDRLQLCSIGRCCRYFIRLIAIIIVLYIFIIFFKILEFNFNITILIVLSVQTIEYFGCILFSLTSRRAMERFFIEINTFNTLVCKKCFKKSFKEKIAFITTIVIFNLVTVTSYVVLIDEHEAFSYMASLQTPPTLVHNIELFVFTYMVTMVYQRVHTINKHWEEELSRNSCKENEKINEKMENIMMFYRVLCNAMLHLKNGIKWQVGNIYLYCCVLPSDVKCKII